MAEKEIEIVKKAEEKALSIIANSEKEAETILKSAKAQGETTHKQEISKFRDEMNAKIKDAEGQITIEADGIRELGKKEAENIKSEGSTRLDAAVSHILNRVVGD